MINILVAKSLSTWLMIFLEELPRCGIGESKVLMTLRVFFKSHVAKLFSIGNLPNNTGHDCAFIVVITMTCYNDIIIN